MANFVAPTADAAAITCLPNAGRLMLAHADATPGRDGNKVR